MSTHNLSNARDESILLARKIMSSAYVVLDTETNSLTQPEACSIALVNERGDVWESLVRPSKPIDAGAMAVHHITNEMVASAPSLKDCLDDILNFIGNAPVVIYNAKFDTEVIKRSIPDFKFQTVCDAMEIYSMYNGEWNYKYGNYRWCKLGEALAKCGLQPIGTLHGAAVDAYMTRELLAYISKQKLSMEVVECQTVKS
jgi:DNA polymerase-3 subunit epsilon